MRITILCLLLASAASLQSQASYDAGECAARLADILVADYDSKPFSTPVEAAIKYFGRSSYISLLQTWKKERHDLARYTPSVDAAYRGVIKRIKADAPSLASGFEESIVELTRVSLLNLELYHEALMNSQPKSELSAITQDDVSRSVLRAVYKAKLYELMDREETATRKIRTVLANPAVAPKLGFYIYLFDTISGMRKKSLDFLRSTLARIGG